MNLGVLPSLSGNNLGDGGVIHREVLSYVSLPFTVCSSHPNFQDVIRLQLNSVSFLSRLIRAMQELVLFVFGTSAPREIVNVIVRLAAVEMPALHTIWAWSDKRQEHKFMYKCSMFAPFMPEAYSAITILGGRWFQSLSFIP